MNLYNCFVKYDQDNKIEDVIVIAENFSFNALIFNCFFFSWFIYHRMWRELFFLFSSILCINLLSNLIFNYDHLYIEIAFYIIAALNCKTWLGEHLVKNKKYKLVGMVFGNNQTEAKIKAIQQIQGEDK